MSTYPLQTLIRKWGREELTIEQAIGQVLLHLQELETGLKTLEQVVYRRRRGDESQEGQ